MVKNKDASERTSYPGYYLRGGCRSKTLGYASELGFKLSTTLGHWIDNYIYSTNNLPDIALVCQTKLLQLFNIVVLHQWSLAIEQASAKVMLKTLVFRPTLKQQEACKKNGYTVASQTDSYFWRKLSLIYFTLWTPWNRLAHHNFSKPWFRLNKVFLQCPNLNKVFLQQVVKVS